MSSLLLQAGIRRRAYTACLHSGHTPRLPSRCYSAQALLATRHSSEFENTDGPHPEPPISEQDGHLEPEPVTPAKIKGKKTAKADSSKAQPKAKRASKAKPLEPLTPAKVELYLASLTAAGLTPDLVDIDRCRPQNHANPAKAAYAEEYNGLVDTLCRSFSKDQLRAFGEMYGLDPIWTRPNRKKVEYAESIIEKQWGWPSLKEVERQKRDRTEVNVKSFLLNPSQLFLILGKDGADLLQLSIQYNVHISLASNPLALRVEGLRGALKDISERIVSLKKGIAEETLQLPSKTPLPQDLVQRISRLAGAYIENVGGKGKVRICAKDPLSLSNAKRLAVRAACISQDASSTPLLSYLPADVPDTTPIPTSLFPRTYSLYPFLSPRALPWTMATNGAFRVRKVGEWLSTDTIEDLERTGGLAAGQGQLLTVAGLADDLKASLLSGMPELDREDGTSRVVTASMGHLLFNSPAAGQRATLIPPLKGYWQLPKIMKWVETSHSKAHFLSSLPPPLLKSAPSQSQKMLHRLVYRIVPGAADQSHIECQPPLRNATGPAKVIRLEIILSDGDASSKTETEQSTDGEGVCPEENIQPTSEPADNNYIPQSNIRCWIGTEAALDLMMPDRPVDMRLVITDSLPLLPGQEPLELRQYMSDLQAYLEYRHFEANQPIPPVDLELNGDRYMLDTSSSVRQSAELVSISRSELLMSGNASGDSPIQVVTESSLDLESSQKSTSCQVVCPSLTSDEDWRGFLRDCDRLSTIAYRPIGALGISSQEDLVDEF
ncbi:hypothetical protein JAAARDRAFT_169728 [Jaapia argillacea MUCL 33604]|uniref:Uncharacterized protein n=1 Tax=Jaapia argillacea MUCL 33604 TaxID=933084 RepID=A0A067QBV7_9AGAM|nr:hypothetical protein JAAARDRAFT_169728 [Jaapia argillacea MUCL 33604]